MLYIFKKKINSTYFYLVYTFNVAETKKLLLKENKRIKALKKLYASMIVSKVSQYYFKKYLSR